MQIKNRKLWWLLAAVWLIVGGEIAVDLSLQHQKIGHEEAERLIHQTAMVQARLANTLQLYADLLSQLGSEAPSLLRERMQVLTQKVDGVHTLTVAAADGTLLASSQEMNEQTRSFYRQVQNILQNARDPQTLYVTEPLPLHSKVYSLALSRVINDRQGQLKYIVTAIIDPAYFQTLLDSTLATDDMRVTLVHGGGTVLYRYPDAEAVVGKNLMTSPGLFPRHISGGKSISTLSGVTGTTGENRLVVMRNVLPTVTKADFPLVVAPSRSIDAMYGTWWHSAQIQMALYGLLVLCSGLGLWFFSRHQEAMQRLTTQQESELRKRDEQFRSLGDNLPDSALCQYVLDSHGTLSFIYMSAGIATITGIEAEEILRNPQRLRDQFLPEDWEKLIAQQKACGETLADLDVTLPMFRMDGEMRWMHFHSRARHLPDGGVVWDGVQTDVTQRKQAEDELVKYKNHLQVMVHDHTETLIAKERFIHSLVDNLPGMVSYWDKNLRCQFANRAYHEWFGFQPGKMLGSYLPDLFGDEFYAANEGAIQAVLQGQAQVFERRLTKPNGEAGYLLAHYLPDVAEGQVVGYIALVSDVTVLKESEKALIKAKQAAEAANIAKSRFLGTMGHELRTPLNAILGMAQLLQFSGLDESDRQEYAGTIVSSGRSLLTLLNDILDLSRLEEGAVALAKTELMPDFLLSEVLNLHEANAMNKGLHMDAQWLGDVPLCFGDRSRVRQMLSNLTSNALKFTEEGEVKLYGREISRDDDKVVLEFSVSDTGIGIAPEQQAKLFLPFTQLDDAANRKFEGAGLGLSIVKELAHLMGGEVGVDSIPGEGARFWLQLPFSLAHDVALLDMEASLA